MPIRIHGIEELVNQMGRFQKKLHTGTRKLQQTVAKEMFVGIINRTPVDTGFALASWRMNTGRILKSTASKGDYKLRSSRKQISLEAARSNALQKATQQLSNLKFRPGATGFPSIFISNNVPYIGKLEGTEGGPSSAQAPAGMVVVTKNALLEKFRTLKVLP